MEQCFGLMYGMKMSWADLRIMERQDREWMLKRLNRQIHDEIEAQKKAQK